MFLVAGWLLSSIAVSPVSAQETAPAGRGTAAGTIVDAANARPIVGATVEVLGDPGGRERTGTEGRFRIDLPPGTYRLRISAPNFGETTLDKVVITEGRSTMADASLKPVPRSAKRAGVEVIDVTADVTESTEATQLLKRKMAPTVSDSLGAEAIGKTPDSDAAEVVTRVPAVTIKDDKFIIVRGLGERYSSALLNGSRLPSTDPNRRIVPLDLFPADFIESLNIIKTYTPDLPGDFSGGLVEIKLAEPPAHLTYGLSTSLSFNTETTFQDYDTYDGWASDWLTFGDGPRELPSAFDIFPNSPTEVFEPTTTQMRSLVGSLPLNWNINSATAPPNFSIDGFVGDTWGPFGINLAAAYGWKFSVHRGEVQNSYTAIDQINQNSGEVFTYNVSEFETQLGAVLTSQYEISDEHKLLARALVNRQGVDEVQVGQGVDGQKSNLEQFPKSSQYTASQLGFGALEGLHHFSLLDLDWRGSWAPSSQEIPDAKFYTYSIEEGSPPPPILTVTATDDLAPERTWASLSEFLQDYYVDATIPFRTRLPFTDVWRGLAGQVKTGANYAFRDRSYLYQSFDIAGTSLVDQLNLALPPDSLLIPANFSDEGPLEFDRRSYQPFDASQEIAAMYGMADLPLIEDRLRVIGGSRVEYSYISGRAFLEGKGYQNIRLNDLNPMPALSVVYTPRDDMNVRGAFSQTVSRPEFRELTPVKYAALPGERILVGNPDLVSAEITNLDLRWEWFLNPLELLSASFFYKDLTNPIELVTGRDAGGGAFDVYVNYDSASLYGFEFESRKDFNFAVPYARRVSWLADIAPHLADVQLLINVSIVESTTSENFKPVDPSIATVAPAPGEKPLQGQSPFVVNAALEYEDYRWGLFRLLYNTVGETIVAKGTKFATSPAVPDIEQQRRDQLDFVWLSEVTIFDVPLSTKFAVENILNDAFEETQGPRTTNHYRTGVTFSTGVSYSF
jgi:outer membrane receptor protein involved in Fe transport